MQSLLALALASVAFAAPAPGVFKTPIRERSLTNADGTVNVEALVKSLNHTLVKYGQPALDSARFASHQKRQNNLALTDQLDSGEDELYYGPITIGKANQKFTIDFDTGSADLFVPGPNCATGCSGKAKYNNQGQDQHNTTTVTYGSGMISGENYVDTVSAAGLTVPKQGLVSLTTAQGFDTSASDGLMGMGFSTIANSKFPTFMENLIAAKTVKANEFSFYLGRGKSNTQGQSELTFGGRDTSRFTGTPAKVPVTTKGYWQVAIDSAKVGGASAGLTTKGQAAIDTGTTIVVAPSAAAAAIYAKIPGSIPYPLSGGIIVLYLYPCSANPKVSLTFAGKDYAINALDFNLGSAGLGTDGLIPGLPSTGLGSASPAAGYCIGGVGSADLDPTQNLYIVGDTFLKNWYSIYNYDNGASVSFAPAKGNQ